MVAMKGTKRKTFNKKKRGRYTSSRMMTLSTKISDKQFFDTTVAFTTNSNIVQYIPLFLPTAGTGSASRYGDRTSISAIQACLSITPGSAQTQRMFLRMLLVWDYQSNSATPTGPQPLVTASITSFKNPDLSSRFKIIKDVLIPVATAAGAVPGVDNNENQDLIQKWYFGGQKLVSQFVASAGAIGDVASGALLLCTVTNIVLTANDTPAISGTFRVTFNS